MTSNDSGMPFILKILFFFGSVLVYPAMAHVSAWCWAESIGCISALVGVEACGLCQSLAFTWKAWYWAALLISFLAVESWPTVAWRLVYMADLARKGREVMGGSVWLQVSLSRTGMRFQVASLDLICSPSLRWGVSLLCPWSWERLGSLFLPLARVLLCRHQALWSLQAAIALVSAWGTPASVSFSCCLALLPA